MILDLERQPSGRSELAIAGTLPLDMPEGQPESADLTGTLVVQNLDHRALLNGTLDAVGRAECSRCLEEFEIRWDVPVEVMVLRDVESGETESETLLILQEKGEVDLRDSLRECAVLSYPQAPVCKDDCKGLCPGCGIDRNQGTCECEEGNVDPRWEGFPE
jgi:uncharacterized protein